MLRMLKNISKGKKGQDMAEYSLILSLIAVAVITLLTAMGNRIKALFQTIITAFGG